MIDLWFGNSKPLFPIFLKTFVLEYSELSIDGISFTVSKLALKSLVNFLS